VDAETPEEISMGDEKLSQAGTERLHDLEANIRAAVMELLLEAQQQTMGCSHPPRTQGELYAALNSNRKDRWIVAARTHQLPRRWLMSLV
jgi:hypothetical protein